MKNNDKQITNIIYEAATMKRMKRVGFQILGNGEESIGEHSFMTAVIAYFLAKKLHLDIGKTLTMSIFHDMHETRVGDAHKIALKYITRNQKKANNDIFGLIDQELVRLLDEYEERKTPEAQIVFEANVIALLVRLKPLTEQGDIHAEKWMMNKTRIRTPEAVELTKILLETDSQDWWLDIQNELEKEFKKNP
ncbi:MAG: Metal dependent phosphohydrolase [Microgenomates group bacterium GW2011_GWB1_40_9]|nr:MAG: Metal dependent phosphohydrolase [Microgenomates group bacterium GW2011_GWC1_39_12]KKR79574.1 MAG: Metal dependent phosphohydrolase [Microgenomates group bacterium GW2011_GWB1_40_9]